MKYDVLKLPLFEMSELSTFRVTKPFTEDDGFASVVDSVTAGDVIGEEAEIGDVTLSVPLDSIGVARKIG